MAALLAQKDAVGALDAFEGEAGFGKAFTGAKQESALIVIGEARFELTSSLHPQSVIAKFIETKGEGIHHVSLEVDQFD